MMHDPKAANKLQVARQTASYKMQCGLAKRARKQKKKEKKGKKKKDKSWKKEYFSSNIDEATSSNLHKVLTLLVSY